MVDCGLPADVAAESAAALRAKCAFNRDCWRAVPVEQWATSAGAKLHWWSRTIGFARGLVGQGAIAIDEQWTPAELDARWTVAVSGKPGISVRYNTHQDQALAAWTTRAPTHAIAVALVATCQLDSTLTLVEQLSPAQRLAIKRARVLCDAVASESISRSSRSAPRRRSSREGGRPAHARRRERRVDCSPRRGVRARAQLRRWWRPVRDDGRSRVPVRFEQPAAPGDVVHLPGEALVGRALRAGEVDAHLAGTGAPLAGEAALQPQRHQRRLTGSFRDFVQCFKVLRDCLRQPPLRLTPGARAPGTPPPRRLFTGGRPLS
jgi:hypothetical protein